MSSNEGEQAKELEVFLPKSKENLGDTPDGPQTSEDPKSPSDGQENKRVKTYKGCAIVSIICGCSCIGCKALEYSFKAEHDQDKAAGIKARNYSIISIFTFFGSIIIIILLIFLISYLLTLAD